MHPHTIAKLATFLLAQLSAAQTNVGDLAMTGFSSSTFGIFTGTTPVVGYQAASAT